MRLGRWGRTLSTNQHALSHSQRQHPNRDAKLTGGDGGGDEVVLCQVRLESSTHESHHSVGVATPNNTAAPAESLREW